MRQKGKNNISLDNTENNPPVDYEYEIQELKMKIESLEDNILTIEKILRQRGIF